MEERTRREKEREKKKSRRLRSRGSKRGDPSYLHDELSLRVDQLLQPSELRLHRHSLFVRVEIHLTERMSIQRILLQLALKRLCPTLQLL